MDLDFTTFTFILNRPFHFKYFHSQFDDFMQVLAYFYLKLILWRKKHQHANKILPDKRK